MCCNAVAHLAACIRDDLHQWFDLSNQPAVSPTQWQFIQGQHTGQISIGGLSQRVNLKRELRVSTPSAVLHPWQAAPPHTSVVD